MGQLIHVDYMQVCSYVISQRNQYEDLKLVGLREKSVRDIFFGD